MVESSIPDSDKQYHQEDTITASFGPFSSPDKALVQCGPSTTFTLHSYLDTMG